MKRYASDPTVKLPIPDLIESQGSPGSNPDSNPDKPDPRSILQPLRRRLNRRVGRAAGIGAAGTFEPADRAHAHVVIAEDLAGEPHAAEPRSSSRCFSAVVIFDGSPSINSTRQVVQRAFPPQA